MCALAYGRLAYERLTPERVVAFHRLASNAYIARFLLDGEQVSFEWAAAERLASDVLFENHGVGLWLVREKAAEEPIGFAGFRVFAELGHEPQLLYAVLEPYTNRGYATEMARCLVELARHRLERIISAADAPNGASRRVLEKAGFVEAGEVPGAFGAIVLYEHESSASALLDGRRLELDIARTWDGQPIPEAERAFVRLHFTETELRLAIDAPLRRDPPPQRAPGPCPGLWEHEVVELFLLGRNHRYLEVELGPHGHYLVLLLHGRRQVVTEPQGVPIFYKADRFAERWRGNARVPRAWFPPGLAYCNAYAISGAQSARRYHAWQPVPGPRPDFHRLEHFAPIAKADV